MNRRIGNLEFREANDGGGEVVCWDKDSDGRDFCFVVASWEIVKECVDLRFVGNRAFDPERIDRNVFWALAEYGQTVIEAAQVLARRCRESQGCV